MAVPSSGVARGRLFAPALRPRLRGLLQSGETVFVIRHRGSFLTKLVSWRFRRSRPKSIRHAACRRAVRRHLSRRGQWGPLSARQAAEKMFARQPRWVEALLTLRNIIGTYQKRNARTWTSAIGREADERRAPPFRPQMGDGLDRHPLAGLQQRLEIATATAVSRA
jgi:hypothetical protein